MGLSVLIDWAAPPTGPPGNLQPRPIFATPQIPQFNLSSAGHSNPMSTPSAPFYARPLGSNSSQIASTSYPLPDFDSPFPSSVDPAQFIWAVSSRLPTVEESSPNDEQRSSMSGPSPNVGEPTARVKRPAKRLPSTQEKIVKVTWWRPHGQTAIAPGKSDSMLSSI